MNGWRYLLYWSDPQSLILWIQTSGDLKGEDKRRVGSHGCFQKAGGARYCRKDEGGAREAGA